MLDNSVDSSNFIQKDKFPIAVWLQNPLYAEEYKSIGINTYVGLWKTPTEEQYEALKKTGIKLICHQGDWGLEHINDDMIVGWMHDDEPDNAQPEGDSYGPPIKPEKVISYYNELKAKDPSRPIYLNLGKGVYDHDWIGRGVDTGKTHMYPEYVKGTDIISYDVYPVNDGYELSAVAKGIDNLYRWSNNEKPVWCWIETSKIGEGTAPNPSQIKSEVWMALIHGVKGFGYFCHSFVPSLDDAYPLHHSDIKEGLAAINAEVTLLAPVLNSPSLYDFAEVSLKDAGNLSENGTSGIDMIAKEWQGETYIFSVNMSTSEAVAEFKLAHGVSVEVLGEDRQIKVEQGQFNDNFEGYGVHLYKIKM